MRNRQFLLAQLALLALVLPFEAHAASPIAAVAASRTSGNVPLMVFFDATGTTDADLTKPIHHLTYCFDGGDGSLDTYSQAGHKTTNKENFCGGPLWAYVYETTGTHTMTLTVIDEDGNTSTETVGITVNAWASSDTTCVSTSGTFDQPAGICDTEITSSDFDAQAPAANKRVLFRCGENFATSATMSIPDGAQIGAYDSSGTVTNRRCQFNITSGSPNPLIDVTGDDARVMDGNDQASTTGAFISGDNAATDTDHLLVQNWNTSTNSWIFSLSAIPQAGGTLPKYIGFFSNNFQTCSTGGSNCFYTAIEYFAIVDTILADSAQHTIRLQHTEDTWIHNSKFEGGPENRTQLTARGLSWNGCIGDISSRYAENLFVSDTWFDGNSDWMLQLGASNDCSGETEPKHRNYIIERNYLTTDAGTEQVLNMIHLDLGCCANHDVTVRNNVCDTTGAETFGQCMGGAWNSGVEVYGNTMYSDAHSRNFWAYAGWGCDVFKNNLAWDGSGSQVMIDGGTCTSQSNNADANGGETGIADLTSCPFVSCSSPTLAQLASSSGNPETVDQGVAVPYRCDFSQQDAPENSLYDIGAYEEGTSTSVCTAAATVAQQPGQNHRINSVTP